jgi:hypothetical protein
MSSPKPFVLSAFGVRVLVDIRQPEVYTEFRLRCILPGWRTELYEDQLTDGFVTCQSKKGGGLRLTGTVLGDVTRKDVDETLSLLEGSISRDFALSAKRSVFVRGSVLLLGGRTVGFVDAKSGTPPSLLLWALIQQGGQLFSGRVMVLSHTLRARPYPCDLYYRSADEGIHRLSIPKISPPSREITDLIFVCVDGEGTTSWVRRCEAAAVSALQNSSWKRKVGREAFWSELTGRCNLHYLAVRPDELALAAELVGAMLRQEGTSPPSMKKSLA